MYDYFKGTLIEVDGNKAIVEVQNIGYQIFIPMSLQSLLPQIGSNVCLYTSLIIKEDEHALYGFITKNQRQLFEVLISISGIGPKTALTILGGLDLEQLVQAIASADTRLLIKIPGIGKKTAERLVMEMKDKIQHFDLPAPTKNGKKNNVSDALHALIHLGYSPMQAQKALNSALDGKTEEIETGKLIALALKKI
jgi:Holliday junction DNA helicase RuvA